MNQEWKKEMNFKGRKKPSDKSIIQKYYAKKFFKKINKRGYLRENYTEQAFRSQGMAVIKLIEENDHLGGSLENYVRRIRKEMRKVFKLKKGQPIQKIYISKLKKVEEVVESEDKESKFSLGVGLPDFLLFNPKKGEFVFVEIKGVGLRLRESQEERFSYLQESGFPVLIYGIDTHKYDGIKTLDDFIKLKAQPIKLDKRNKSNKLLLEYGEMLDKGLKNIDYYED